MCLTKDGLVCFASFNPKARQPALPNKRAARTSPELTSAAAGGKATRERIQFWRKLAAIRLYLYNALMA